MSPTSEFMFFLETVKHKLVLGNKKLRKSKKENGSVHLIYVRDNYKHKESKYKFYT